MSKIGHLLILAKNGGVFNKKVVIKYRNKVDNTSNKFIIHNVDRCFIYPNNTHVVDIANYNKQITIKKSLYDFKNQDNLRLELNDMTQTTHLVEYDIDEIIVN